MTKQLITEMCASRTPDNLLAKRRDFEAWMIRAASYRGTSWSVQPISRHSDDDWEWFARNDPKEFRLRNWRASDTGVAKPEGLVVVGLNYDGIVARFDSVDDLKFSDEELLSVLDRSGHRRSQPGDYWVTDVE